MPDLKRESKKEFDLDTLREELLEELGLENTRLFCHLRKSFEDKTVDLTNCVRNCPRPCKNFLLLKFVSSACLEEDCLPNSPCRMCLEEVERYKVYIAALGAMCNDSLVLADKRFKGFIKRRNK